MENNNFKNETMFIFIEDIYFRNEIATRVSISTSRQHETNLEVCNILGISNKKLWEIKKGKSKDINAIINFINYHGFGFSFDCLK